MDFLTDRFFSFTSRALDAETFAVVTLQGQEGLGRCYRFDIELVTDNAEIDMESVLRHGATLTIHRQDGDDVRFNGMLCDFEQQHAAGDVVFYRAVLVPRLWRLGLTHHNQVFLDMTVKEMVEAVLKDGGLTANDYAFKLQSEYPQQRYVCQYNESHLDFISRRLEREGIYYYFEQTESSEKIIFTDTAIAHQARSQGSDLPYAPQTAALMDADRNEVVLGLVCRQKPLPGTIRLKDYNYRKPSLEVAASATVDPTASGEVYLYGEHFDSPQEGERLANIRAQELICGKQTFIGDSTVPYITPGYTFTLDGHYRKSYNQKYLTLAVTHEGSQTGFMIAGLQAALADREKQTFYRNQFTAIAAAVQFRSPRNAPQPKITGTLNARIDAAGSGKYAELDEHGRYKVILPFDLSGRKDGKASAWLRMAQPYAGAGHGMHFPLHKGTEVLLTFIEGNPDRPVIAAAVPNPEAPSPVTAADQTMAKITTGGGNRIHIEDQEGSERILLHSPNQGSFIRIGAHNDPDDGPTPGVWGEWHGIAHCTKGVVEVKCQTKNEFVLGEDTLTILGGHMKNVFGLAMDITAGMEIGLKIGGEVKFSPWHHEFREEKTKLHKVKTELTDQILRLERSNTRLRQRVTDLTDDIVRLVGDKTELTDTCTRLNAQLTELSEANERITGEQVRISESVTSLSETTTRLDSTVVTLSESVVTMQESEVKLAEDIATVAEVQTVLNENINTIAAVNNML